MSLTSTAPSRRLALSIDTTIRIGTRGSLLATTQAGVIRDEIIRLGQDAGELRRDLPFELLEALFEFCFIILAQRYYEQREAFDLSRAVGQCVELFMNGAGKERAR